MVGCYNIPATRGILLVYSTYVQVSLELEKVNLHYCSSRSYNRAEDGALVAGERFELSQISL